MTNGGVGEEPAKRTEEETCTREFFFWKTEWESGNPIELLKLKEI